ncbi:MAG: hypothetical protein ACREC9_16320 [Methylocella sp.]
MEKRIIYACALAAALFAGPAFALQNVANTSQKGSLLIFPLITVDRQHASNTLIEITNGETSAVHVECSYVNERKGRADFDFNLTGKATASWEVLTGTGTISAPLFPSGDNCPPPIAPICGSITRGELVCFAVNLGGTGQIAFNHLSGTATVVNLADTPALQSRQAFRYNSWAFLARNASGMPEVDNTPQGTPGVLVLSGGLAGTYDGCPKINIASFNPNGAALGGVTTLDNDMVGVSCNQDLRQDFVLHTTKLQFTVWNANENSFTGSYACVDSVFSVPLGAGEGSTVVNRSNFDFSTVQTANARFEVQGVSSTQCPPGTEPSGLLAVYTSSLCLRANVAPFCKCPPGVLCLPFDPNFPEDAEMGSTTQTAGSLPGFVLWDPAGTVPFGSRH